MSDSQDSNLSRRASAKQSLIDQKLAAYLAAIASGSLLAKEAGAVVVSNSSVIPFGVNGEVNIDFNSDGQADYQIDHDRVDLGLGTIVDYLQIDKNDETGASLGEDPLAIPDIFATFPLNGTNPNDTFEAAYAVPVGQADYPAALLSGQEIGPSTTVFDFQEGDNAFSTGRIIRANRLIDEDHTQVDTILGGHGPDDFYPITNGPNFIGLGGQIRYLGVKMDFQDANAIHYGWIGIRITNEADATGEVVGWGYETEAGVSIQAGELGVLQGDYNGDGKVDTADYVVWRKSDGTTEGYNTWKTNFGSMAGGGAGAGGGFSAVPEPSSLLLSLAAGVAIIGSFLFRRIRGS
jgi:hypothetical protein